MKSPLFAYLFRMKHIQRWGLMRNTIPENILEHSSQVAMVSHMLGVFRNTRYGGSVDIGKLVILAMYHDCTEVYTSDLPTPIKYLTPDLKNAFKEIENIISMRFYSMVPEDVRDDFESVFISDESDNELYELVKAADVICAFYKCVDESQSGNSDFTSAQTTLRDTLNNMDVPEIDDFFSEFGEQLMLPFSINEC